MEPQAAPQRKLRRIKPKPKLVKYGYGDMFEGTPKQAAAFWAALAGQTYDEYRARLAAPYRSTYQEPARAKVTRSRNQHVSTISLPRTRSREQSHAPRSTSKAAQRSGASGDCSDPPGSSPAALAVLLLFLLRGVDS